MYKTNSEISCEDVFFRFDMGPLTKIGGIIDKFVYKNIYKNNLPGEKWPKNNFNKKRWFGQSLKLIKDWFL